jgi:hypothetical protein
MAATAAITTAAAAVTIKASRLVLSVIATLPPSRNGVDDHSVPVLLVGAQIIPRMPCRIRGAGDEKAPERPVLTVAQVFELARLIKDRRFRALVLLVEVNHNVHRHPERCGFTRADWSRLRLSLWSSRNVIVSAAAGLPDAGSPALHGHDKVRVSEYLDSEDHERNPRAVRPGLSDPLIVSAVMMSGVGDGDEQQGDELDSEDAFDRRVSDILDAEADLLREHAERLIANGSISIERPAGMVTARFREPVLRYHGGGAWHRRPELDIEAIPAEDTGRLAGERGPMVSKYGHRADLIREITSALALYFAWLEDDE